MFREATPCRSARRRRPPRKSNLPRRNLVKEGDLCADRLEYGPNEIKVELGGVVLT